MKYCSHIVELTNIGGTFVHHSDFTGETDDYYIYDMANPEYEMHYSLGATIGSVDPNILGVDKIMGENLTLTALMNFNCLDGYYVFYGLKLENPTDVENNKISNNKIYASNKTLYIETIGGQNIEVYTLDGQSIYTTTNSSNMTEINNLEGMVIVKINGETHKALIK